MVQENEVSGIDLKIKNNDPKPNGSKRSEGKKYYARGLKQLKLDLCSLQSTQPYRTKEPLTMTPPS